MNFIFNEVPDHVSKNLVLCSFHFNADLFTNKAQLDTGFSEILKLKAVPAVLGPTVMSYHTSVSNCFNYMITIALAVKQTVRYVYRVFMRFLPKTQQRPSVKAVSKLYLTYEVLICKNRLQKSCFSLCIPINLNQTAVGLF